MKLIFHYLRYIGIAVGLYRIRTIISKLFEIINNNKRFYRGTKKSLPLQFETDEIEAAPPMVQKQNSRRMRIFYIVHCFYPSSHGGTERFVFNMAKEAKRAGNDVKIITYNALSPRSHFRKRHHNIFFDEYGFDGLDVIEYRHKKAPLGIIKEFLLNDPDTISFANSLFRDEKPDIVHFGYMQKVSSFITACKENNIPYIITLTSYFVLCHYDIMIDGNGDFCTGCRQGEHCAEVCRSLDIADCRSRYQNAYQVLREAAGLVVPAAFVKKVIEKEFEKLTVLINPHAISFSSYHSIKNEPHQLHASNFAYIGKIAPLKGVHDLIAAFKLMPQTYTLNIYGSGSEKYLNHLKALARGHHNIIFHGAVSYNKMAEVYSKIDIVVIPSLWYETYNYVLHEAIMMNKVVVAARLGAMSEGVRQGENGFLVEPGNIQALKLAMEKAVLLSQSDNRSDKSIPLTLQKEYSCYNEIYERVLEENRNYK